MEIDTETFDRDRYKIKALQIIQPISKVSEKTLSQKHFPSIRSDAGSDLSIYYLVYFLFADLLDFENLGQSEKVAWSFPINFNGKKFAIEYRKFGLGVFVQNKKEDENSAREIVSKINAAVKAVRPFYNHVAELAVKNSKINVINNNAELYDRFDYLLSLFKRQKKKYLEAQQKFRTVTENTPLGVFTYDKPAESWSYYKRSNWLAISCIEAFYSWTEHLFIHLAVIARNLSDGEKVSRLIEAEWKDKFRAAIPENTSEVSRFYNELLIVRQQLRNFVAHGAFGKDGNAFQFHSETGLVPVVMRHSLQRNRFSLQGDLSFEENEVIRLIEEFISFLWKSDLEPAMYYTQKRSLPTILTLAANGKYKSVANDPRAMKKFCEGIEMEITNAENMDW